MKRIPVLTALLWTARALSAAALALWTPFFVEHTAQWFTGEAWPPAWVVGLHAMHLGVLVSLVAAWRWPRAGGLLILGFGAAFFGAVNPLLVWTVAPTGLLFLAAGWLKTTADRVQECTPRSS